MEKQKVVFTGEIPQCPHCQKPTKRTGGIATVTAMYFKPIYDEKGNNTNPDKNIRTSHYECYECKKGYTVTGNEFDGYTYS